MLRSFRQRPVLLLVAMVLPGMAALQASEILFKDGKKLTDVTILERGEESVTVQMQYGTLKYPLADVARIDGKPVGPPAPVPAPLPRPSPSEPPEILLPLLPAAEAPAPPAGPYTHRWTMDLFLLGLGAAIAAWLGILLWVQRDADTLYQGRIQLMKRWNTIVLLLPGLGVLFYLGARVGAARQLRQMRERAREAGTPVREVPRKKRWSLLGGKRTERAVETRQQKLRLEFMDGDGQPIQIKKDLPGMSGIESAHDLLAEALVERASDVHIEPRDQGWRVRFRIDGVLQQRKLFEKTDSVRMVAALKSLAQIDVAEKRKAQDGRFRVRTAQGEVDLRVATTSSIHGEKMVLRILDRKTGLLGLSELGMPDPMQLSFNRVIHSRSGMILVTGPTGSGKTTTLYAALNQLDAHKLNIMTIEDPVEYELPGATQIPVNPRAGITYAAGLRSILRQDPDVIFIGEMRDEEAAKIALRAALTGHLVFSTLHTKNAISTVTRLQEVGVEKYQIASALLMVVAQRLVRVLCRECREPCPVPPAAAQELGLALPQSPQIYCARGCELCDETGYLGRSAIFELLVMDDELRRAFTEGAGEQVLWEMAHRKGSRPFREHGVEKILKGITTVEEVIQAE